MIGRSQNYLRESTERQIKFYRVLQGSTRMNDWRLTD